MSKVHVLAGNGGTYNLVIHTSMPAGVNAVLNSWKAVYLAARAPVTQLTIGTGLGHITSSEAAQVASADVLEFSAQLVANPSGASPTATQVGNFADAVIADELADLQVALKFYGYTQ